LPAIADIEPRRLLAERGDFAELRLRAAAEVCSTIAAFCWVDWSIVPIATRSR
jgi:hypothetical protein